jgi:hypothetical protein
MHELDLNLENFIWDEDQLSEVFASPIGLKPVVKIDGQPLYGSDRLNESYLKAIEKCGRTSAASLKFRGLVEKKRIVPCFLTKSLLGFVAWKVFAPVHMKSIMGFYDPTKTKRVYILIQNNANIFSFVSNDFLAKLSIHELMHMLADQKTSVFMSIFSNELTAYYKELYQMIFSINNLDNARVDRILKFVFMDIERKSEKLTNGTLNKYSALMKKELSSVSSLSPLKFDEMLQDYFAIIKLYLTNVAKFFVSRDKFRHILIPCYLSYKNAFNMKNLSTVCIQELIFPSEVVAILSEDMRYGKKALIGAAKL